LADKWSLNANQKRDSYLDYVGKVTVVTELVEDDLMEVALELDVSDVKESEGAFEFIVPARGTKKINFIHLNLSRNIESSRRAGKTTKNYCTKLGTDVSRRFSG
jgi:transcriptional/translational regulatory protein YebC/TACO1